jgi:adenine-specific DNA methylase
MVVSDSEEADARCKKCGAEQRHRRNHTYLERRKTERRQVNRQEQRDKAVAEVAQ